MGHISIKSINKLLILNQVIFMPQIYCFLLCGTMFLHFIVGDVV